MSNEIKLLNLNKRFIDMILTKQDVAERWICIYDTDIEFGCLIKRHVISDINEHIEDGIYKIDVVSLLYAVE
jgi:hypothetical protein